MEKTVQDAHTVEQNTGPAVQHFKEAVIKENIVKHNIVKKPEIRSELAECRWIRIIKKLAKSVKMEIEEWTDIVPEDDRANKNLKRER